MNDTISGLMASIRASEDELERLVAADLQAKAERFRYRADEGGVTFDPTARAEAEAARPGMLRYVLADLGKALLAGPFLWAMLVPIALLDVTMMLYQHSVFRIYGIARVRRSRFVVMDRRMLPYLNAIEKLNCLYCSYANGVVACAREIAARTEQHWCPIKHARRVTGTHARYRDFLEYGDAAAWRAELPALRAALRDAGD